MQNTCATPRWLYDIRIKTIANSTALHRLAWNLGGLPSEVTSELGAVFEARYGRTAFPEHWDDPEKKPAEIFKQIQSKADEISGLAKYNGNIILVEHSPVSLSYLLFIHSDLYFYLNLIDKNLAETYMYFLVYLDNNTKIKFDHNPEDEMYSTVLAEEESTMRDELGAVEFKRYKLHLSNEEFLVEEMYGIRKLIEQKFKDQSEKLKAEIQLRLSQSKFKRFALWMKDYMEFQIENSEKLHQWLSSEEFDKDGLESYVVLKTAEVTRNEISGISLCNNRQAKEMSLGVQWNCSSIDSDYEAGVVMGNMTYSYYGKNGCVKDGKSIIPLVEKWEKLQYEYNDIYQKVTKSNRLWQILYSKKISSLKSLLSSMKMDTSKLQKCLV